MESQNKKSSETSGMSIAKPKFGDCCDMCLGCIYNCPQKALRPTWGAFQVDKKGYDLQLMYKTTGLNV